MKAIAIKEHKFGSVEILPYPKQGFAGEAIEEWQKQTIYYQVHGKLPACTWQVIEGESFVDLLIGSTKL